MPLDARLDRVIPAIGVMCVEVFRSREPVSFASRGCQMLCKRVSCKLFASWTSQKKSVKWSEADSRKAPVRSE